ncbi:unnamed protein product [Paramecium sonneborni]|uniref:Uncharacterized protein n=1 Tax=Paramecium sonneborni TaxID=65129 RepID=A0A8S1RPS3_9CILI|nr:unnamed protein product [Paramecium sonneborni]
MSTIKMILLSGWYIKENLNILQFSQCLLIAVKNILQQYQIYRTDQVQNLKEFLYGRIFFSKVKDFNISLQISGKGKFAKSAFNKIKFEDAKCDQKNESTIQQIQINNLLNNQAFVNRKEIIFGRYKLLSNNGFIFCQKNFFLIIQQPKSLQIQNQIVILMCYCYLLQKKMLCIGIQNNQLV